jgi:hypothetical protein
MLNWSCELFQSLLSGFSLATIDSLRHPEGLSVQHYHPPFLSFLFLRLPPIIPRRGFSKSEFPRELQIYLAEVGCNMDPYWKFTIITNLERR